MEQIVWKSLENYSKYQISNAGQVKNINTKKLIKGTISQGYLRVRLYPDDNDKPKNFRVHRIVAELFCDNENNYTIVNHVDCNKLNNHADNLEWVTTRQNTRHATQNGKMSVNNQRKVRRICSKTKKVKEYDSITEAYQNNMDKIKYDNYIISVCNGTQKTTGGYKWEYVNEILSEQEPEDGKIIQGFSNYMITNDGKIYSKSSKRFLNPSVNNAGYLIIDLHGDQYDENKDHTTYTRKRASKRKKFRVHRLVTEYFLPERDPECLEVNHKNKDREDNRVENLEWVTSQQNLEHAHCKKIRQLDEDGNVLRLYNSLVEASKLTGIKTKTISSGLRRGKKAKGYIWEYV